MKLHTLWAIGFAVCIVGCAEKEQAVPEQRSEMEPAVSAPMERPATGPEAISGQSDGWRNSDFLDHMHAHAEQLDDLNYALDDDDLERAKTPAYWLSRHKAVSGIPADMQPFVDRMREAAQVVEEAEDLMAARAGAKRIAVECQGCHAAVGVVTR